MMGDAPIHAMSVWAGDGRQTVPARGLEESAGLPRVRHVPEGGPRTRGRR